MQILLDETNPASNSSSQGHGIEILEKAAELFCAWQQYDQCVNGDDIKPFISRDWHKENLLSKCANMILACNNALASIGEYGLYSCESEEVELTKAYLRDLLLIASDACQAEYELSLHKSTTNYVDFVSIIECLEEYVCSIIASLGVEDFTGYMNVAKM